MDSNIKLEDIVYSLLLNRIEKYGLNFELNKVKQATWYFVSKYFPNCSKQTIEGEIDLLLKKYSHSGLESFKNCKIIQLEEPKKDKFIIQPHSILRYAVCPNSSPTMLNLKGLCLHKALIVSNPHIKVYFRFDDSSPDNKPATKQAYNGYIKALKWLNLSFEIIYVSDRIERYYEVAKLLLKEKKAYLLHKGKKEYDETLFNKFINSNLPNSVFYVDDMKPWVGLRICKRAHLLKKNYKVWPTLNFHSPIDDIDYNITTIYRGKDLLSTQKKQKIIYDFLKPTSTIKFYYWGRNRLPTYSVHSSTLLKEKNLYDPKTIFFENLIYYEIRPNALYEFYREIGFSNTDTVLNIGLLRKYQKNETPSIYRNYILNVNKLSYVHFYEEHITGNKGFIFVNDDFKKLKCHETIRVGKDYFKINPQKKLIKLIF
jgi:glutamyl-tRNA synthetase